MELSNEDAFRLNVMLANDVEAIRINESTMMVFGLSSRGESSIKLNPNCRDDKYLRGVRELLSSHVLGSPGGYPVYLKRWTRMGQTRDTSLDRLLMLGEPEAVVAVVNASGLTGELARLAWWSMPDAHNGRCMLACKKVSKAPIGKELAEFLVEFLAFEEDPEAMMESVRLVLQPGLIGKDVRDNIWKRAQNKNSYYIGFLQTLPDDLPELLPPHPEWSAVKDALQGLIDQGNPCAIQLCRCLSAEGQTYLHVVEKVMSKPANQEVVVRLLNTIHSYFSSVCMDDRKMDSLAEIADMAELQSHSEPVPSNPGGDELHAVLQCQPELRPMLTAMLILAGVTEVLATPVFARTDAIGTVMRRKLEPVTAPVLALIDCLRSPAS